MSNLNDNIVFRVDANPKVGFGHLMRCMAFAERFILLDKKVSFLTDCEDEDLIKVLKSKNIAIYRTPTGPNSIERVIDICKSKFEDKISLIVIDGYTFNENFQRSVRELGHKILVIDDQGIGSFDCDMILNQNYGFDEKQYKTGEKTRLLIGPKYWLSRQEFNDFSKPRYTEIKPPPWKILITMGGGNVSEKILEVIAYLSLYNDKIASITLLGKNIEIEEITSRFPEYQKVKIVDFEKNMPLAISEADIIISAAGSFLWEVFYIGKPVIALPLSDNQESLLQGIRTKSLAMISNSKSLKNELKLIFEEKEVLKDMVLNQEVLFKDAGMSIETALSLLES